jgi:hypothetical protein
MEIERIEVSEVALVVVEHLPSNCEALSSTKKFKKIKK